jgi:hypothetical protein
VRLSVYNILSTIPPVLHPTLGPSPNGERI